jgi:cell division FtsZ-interacting protein ZapD
LVRLDGINYVSNNNHLFSLETRDIRVLMDPGNIYWMELANTSQKTYSIWVDVYFKSIEYGSQSYSASFHGNQIKPNTICKIQLKGVDGFIIPNNSSDKNKFKLISKVNFTKLQICHNSYIILFFLNHR